MTSTPRRSAFTLIEVLLATFILGLGVLGLLALFAGAARQQQVSSQETRAHFAARSAQAALAPSFGALRIPNQALFRENVWYRLPMDERHNFLSVNPQGSTQGPYFLVASTVTTPAPLFVRDNYQPPGGGVIGIDCADTAVPGFTGAPTGPYDTADWDFTFVNRRLEPDSIRIAVEVSWCEDTDADGTPDTRIEPRTWEFYRAPGVPYEYDSAHNSATSGLWLLPMNGSLDHDPDNSFSFVDPLDQNYLVIDTQPQPRGTDPARVESMYLGGIRDIPAGDPQPVRSGGRVERMFILDYRWRADQLISLTDRVIARPDPAAPDGRTPEQCYSVLYRRTATASEAVVAAYALVPTASGVRFVPPETFRDIERNDSPIRQVMLTLKYDRDVDQYYLRTTLDDDLWAIQPGQVVLVEGHPVLPNSPGSDEPVRVVRLTRESAEQGRGWRGYLDAVPRAGGQAMLPWNLAESGQGANLRLFAVADTVSSRADGSVWKLAPLRMTVFRVSFSP